MKPNVLIIISDQQRYDTLCSAGYKHMITPNLDRLAKMGVTYSMAHTHNPVCMPARHDLLIGMPAGCHGYFRNCNKPIKDYSLPTLPRLFSESGYRTAAIGKMHFSPSRMHHGYSEMRLMEELPMHRSDDEYLMYLNKVGLGDVQNIHGIRPMYYHTPQTSQVELKHYETTWVKDQTIDWLETNDDAPFMLCVGYIKPHPPWDIPKEYQGFYSDIDLPDPIKVSRGYPENSEKNVWYGDYDNNTVMREIREAYYTSITMVDESVGKILDYLENKGILDNTMIIYTSDHGEMLQDKGFYSKELPYESSVRIPMIIKYPNDSGGVHKELMGHTDDSFVDLMDILPTCLDVADIDYKGDKNKLYGTSLLNLKEQASRGHLIAATGELDNCRRVMCRNKKYKLIYYYNYGTEEMYDMVSDPQEINNIIGEKIGDADYNTLKELIVEYECQWGPEGAIENG